jgi:hypothetical protein
MRQHCRADVNGPDFENYRVNEAEQTPAVEASHASYQLIMIASYPSENKKAAGMRYQRLGVKNLNTYRTLHESW